jgi:hypothetical protein
VSRRREARAPDKESLVHCGSSRLLGQSNHVESVQSLSHHRANSNHEARGASMTRGRTMTRGRSDGECRPRREYNRRHGGPYDSGED